MKYPIVHHKPLFLAALIAGLSGCASNQEAFAQHCDKSTQTCSWDVPPGNYRVALTLNPTADRLQIFAESRRLMLDMPKVTRKHHHQQLTVNVREPEGQPLQPFQKSSSTGIPGLNFTWIGNPDAVESAEIKKIVANTQLFIIGDSTVCDQNPQWDSPPEERFSGWGQMIPRYFDQNLAVINYADSGESSVSFKVDGALWSTIDSNSQPDDWMFIQLGHNDKKTSAEAYRANISAMIQTAQKKQVNVVLISPMIRNVNAPLDDQHIYGDLQVRHELSRLAATYDVPLINLMDLSDKWVQAQGQNSAQQYFVKRDRTHTNERGAAVFADMIVKDIQRQHIAISEFLKSTR